MYQLKDLSHIIAFVVFINLILLCPSYTCLAQTQVGTPPQNQEKVKPFDLKACLSSEKESQEECEIQACMSRPNLTRERCTCLRGCAVQFVKCYQTEIVNGSNKEAADLSCNAEKDQCATNCLTNK